MQIEEQTRDQANSDKWKQEKEKYNICGEGGGGGGGHLMAHNSKK